MEVDREVEEDGTQHHYESISSELWVRHYIDPTQHFPLVYQATASPINYLFRRGMSILHCINVQASHIITYFLCFIKLRFCYEPDNTMRAAPRLDSILFTRSKLLLIDQQRNTRRENVSDYFHCRFYTLISSLCPCQPDANICCCCQESEAMHF
jgi:hypothetical protein